MITKLLSKEPVLLGKAVLATIDLFVLASGLSDGLKAAATLAALAWIGWLERMASAPLIHVEEAAQQGYNNALADVSSLAASVVKPTRKRQ